MKKFPFRRKSLVLIALLLAALGLTAWYFVLRTPDRSPSFPRANLTIERADGRTISFNVEVASTDEQQTYGLMFRNSMPADAGMLFLLDSEQAISFWMKNTTLPLDILFVRADGVIVHIVTHTEPYSLAPLDSDEPVKGALEINAGEVERRGIKIGDKVIYPAFEAR